MGQVQNLTQNNCKMLQKYIDRNIGIFVEVNSKRELEQGRWNTKKYQAYLIGMSAILKDSGFNGLGNKARADSSSFLVLLTENWT